MKLHLPCALRGALFACFALAAAAPTWAANDVVLSDTTLTVNGAADSYLLTPTTDNYTIKTDSSTGVVSLNNLSIKDSVTLTISGADYMTQSASFTIENLLMADGKDLNIVIADNTKVILSNVNFNGTITYTLGTNSTLIISPNDLVKGCITSTDGTASVGFLDGVIDSASATIPSDKADMKNWFTSSAYDTAGGWQSSDNSVLGSVYSAAGSTVIYDVWNGSTVEFNAPGGGSGKIECTSPGNYHFYWNGKSQTVKIPDTDEPSVIIDPETDVYRDKDGLWHLHYDATTGKGANTIQAELLIEGSGKKPTLGDISAAQYVFAKESDTLLFEGSTLTSSSDVTLGCKLASDGVNAIKLAPGAGTTMTFTNGGGALDAGNKLELSGGEYSTVNLYGVTNTAPTGITFLTDNTTLGLAGPAAITLDAAQNTFLATSGLKKLDGGTLTYKAANVPTTTVAGNSTPSSTIGLLSNAGGTLRICASDATTATTLNVTTLTAGMLSITGDNITVKPTNLTATDVYLQGWSGTAGNTGAALESALDITNTAYVGSGALLKGSSIKVNGTTTVAKAAAAYTGEQGIVVDGINVLGNGTDATLEGLNAKAYSLEATSVKNALITTTQGTPTLALGSATNTVIEAATGTTINNTSFTNSTVTGTGSLTLMGTTRKLEPTEPITTPASTTTLGPDTSVTVNGTGASLTLQGVSLLVGNGTGFTVGGSSYTTTVDPNGLGAAQIVIEDGVATKDALTLTNITVYIKGKDAVTTPIELMSGTGGLIEAASGYTFNALTEQAGMVATLTVQNGKLVYTMEDRSEDLIALIKTTPPTSAAADILVETAQAGDTGVIKEFYDYLRNQSFASFEARKAALAAYASGSITMMADSQRRGVVNNINRLRNRVVQMGNPQGIEPEKKIHAWISADGSHNEVDQDGGYAGYEYQTWGGTVGAHVDVGNFSFGAAISAAYGDLTAHSNDFAEGDHDTITLNAFARYQSGHWTQLGILSLGRNELELNRTINASWNTGATTKYEADGDASGHTITAYYEAGYTITLNEECTQVLQPIVSVMLTSARMGDFTETGSIGNAGLCADTEDYFYGTVGIGARYQAVLGTNVEGRLCFAELRAKVVQDFGDETDELSVSIAGAPGQGFTVKGADVGRTGFQFGAGISVPMGVYTTFFADVDADIRSGATSYGGSVGMRVQF